MKLHAPEYANFWADVRRGKTPMYYMGRGTVYDASDASGQLFGTGGSPRVQYSNPKFDELLAAQYKESNPEKRCQVWRSDEPDFDRRRAKPLHVDAHARHRGAGQHQLASRLLGRILDSTVENEVTG